MLRMGNRITVSEKSNLHSTIYNLIYKSKLGFVGNFKKKKITTLN